MMFENESEKTSKHKNFIPHLEKNIPKKILSQFDIEDEDEAKRLIKTLSKS